MDFAELMSKKYLFENKNENETKRGIICKLEFINWSKIKSSNYLVLVMIARDVLLVNFLHAKTSVDSCIQKIIKSN